MDKDRYRKGAHTVLDLKYHIVWKTKYSYAVLTGDLALRAREIIRQICGEKEIGIVKGNIRPNHVHVLVSVPAHFSPAKLVQLLKGRSSFLLQREFPVLRKKYWGQHLWSRGYFCATVGATTEEQVKEYIEGQTEECADFKVWDEKPFDDVNP